MDQLSLVSEKAALQNTRPHRSIRLFRLCQSTHSPEDHTKNFLDIAYLTDLLDPLDCFWSLAHHSCNASKYDGSKSGGLRASKSGGPKSHGLSTTKSSDPKSGGLSASMSSGPKSGGLGASKPTGVFGLHKHLQLFLRWWCLLQLFPRQQCLLLNPLSA